MSFNWVNILIYMLLHNKHFFKGYSLVHVSWIHFSATAFLSRSLYVYKACIILVVLFQIYHIHIIFRCTSICNRIFVIWPACILWWVGMVIKNVMWHTAICHIGNRTHVLLMKWHYIFLWIFMWNGHVMWR